MKRFLVLLAAFAICAGFDADACTTAVVSARASGTGRPMLWKQRDTDHRWNHIEHFNGERYAFTALVNSDDEAPYCSVWAGANEVGFAIMNNASYNLSPEDYANVDKEGIVMKKALAICRTVDEFEFYIQSMEIPLQLETNYGVIDAYGGAAYFEVGDLGYTRYDVEDTPEGYLYRTNFSLSGREDDGAGYIRYETAGQLMAAKGSGFTSEWFLDTPARSFLHTMEGLDYGTIPSSQLGRGFIVDQDFIPRNSTSASIVIEGVTSDMKVDQSIIWCAINYTPVTYAIPVWVAAGDEIPACLRIDGEGSAPASRIAMELRSEVYPIKRGSGPKYLYYTRLRDEIMPLVASAEKEEFEQARKFIRKAGSRGVTAEDVAAFNAKAEARFAGYCEKVHALICRWK